METKVCGRCDEEKPRALFSAHKKHKSGLQCYCKACYAEIARARRIGNPCMNCGEPKEVGVPRGARLCLKCSATCFVCHERPRRAQARRCLPCQLEYNNANRKKPENVVKGRITRIASTYKVPRSEAERLYAIKECQVCSKDVSEPGSAHIDHCHSSGDVRGVLCFNCNASLGHVNDDKERLAGLIGYLANGRQDIEKAIHYLELLLEWEYGDG